MFFKKKTLNFFVFFCIAAAQPAYLFCADDADPAVDNAMRNVARSAQTIIAPGGADDATRQEAMRAVDRSAQELTDIEDRNYGRAVNLFSAITQATIAPGGDLDNTRAALMNMVDRTTDEFNNQMTEVVDYLNSFDDTEAIATK